MSERDLPPLSPSLSPLLAECTRCLESQMHRRPSGATVAAGSLARTYEYVTAQPSDGAGTANLT